MNIMKKCLVAMLAMSAFVVSAPEVQAQSISQILQDIQRDSAETLRENQQREAKFRQERDSRASLLAEARRELQTLESREATIRRQFGGNRSTIDRLTAERDSKTGEFNEVFGLSRTKATEFRAILDNSLVSAEMPDRSEKLKVIAESEALPSSEDLNLMYTTLLDEIKAQRQVKSFSAKVANHNNGEEVEVTRVGPFAVFTKDGGEFLSYTPSAVSKGQLALMKPKTQIGGRPNSAAAALGSATAGQIVDAPIDPTRGNLVKTFDRYPSWQERVAQGGTIGYIIIFGAIALAIFGVLNILRLMATSAAVRGQKRKAQAGKNPLGRIMSAYDGVKDKGSEAVELALDEAILKESPKLELGLSLLKLGAGIAPLMGLLGTVTGMIKTFQAMTIFGTGNAQTMAGGISEALVTTMLGLIAAIPLLILHSFCSSLARGVQATLEEQSAGIVARHVESRSA